MKRFILALIILVGLRVEVLGEQKTNQVWAIGNTIYGQATLDGGTMPLHQFTTKVRFVNARTGAATPWVTRVTYYGSPNVNKIVMARPATADPYRMEAMYSIYCSLGRAESPETKVTLFTIGYSFNCLYLVPKTDSLIHNPQTGEKYYYGLYDLVPGCNPVCAIARHYGFTTPYVKGKADENIQMRFWWVKVLWGSTYCLDAYEVNRKACSAANCGEFAK